MPWGLRLSEFYFSINHIAGKANEDADALSRAIVSSIDMELDVLKKEKKKMSYCKGG